MLIREPTRQTVCIVTRKSMEWKRERTSTEYYQCNNIEADTIEDKKKIFDAVLPLGVRSNVAKTWFSNTGSQTMAGV